MLKRPWRTVRLALFVGAAIAMFAVPTRTVESGPTLCVWQRIFHVQCPGCGMTRAFSHVVHGHWVAAWEHNRGVVIAFPLAAMLWLTTVWRDICSIQRKRQVTSQQTSRNS